jgi:hypothetical protein
MFDKALKLAAVLMLVGVAAGPLPENCLAIDGEPAAQACAEAPSGSGSQAVANATDAGMARDQFHGLPVVCGVSIKPASNGAAIIDIATSQRISYRVIELRHPRRLVVDFEGARNAAERPVYEAQSRVLARVRIGQWRARPTAIARVVADLEGTPTFSVHRRPWGVRIELNPQAAPSRPPVPDPFRYGPRGKQYSAGVAPAKGLSPGAEFPVHQFADLTASLATPKLPRQDRLIPLVKEQPLDSARGDSGKLAVVYGISIKPDADGKTLVDIASSQSVPFRVFQLADPLRLVVDLKDARDASKRGVYPVESPVLKRVRVGQWRGGDPAVVRIVADLEGSPMFDVHAQQPGVRIELKPRRDLGPLIRNPFEFTREGPSIKVSQPSAPATYLPAARTIPSPATGSIALSNLKVLGYLEKPGSGTQAIVSDDLNIYFVPEGGAFEERFRLLKITGNAVEIEDLNTKQTAWLQFTP